MANKDGTKSGGRKRGTPNKSTLKARETAERLGVDPIEILLLFAKGDFEALGEPEPIPRELRQKSAKDVAPYIAPQLKAIEHSGAIEGAGGIERAFYEKHVLPLLLEGKKEGDK